MSREQNESQMVYCMIARNKDTVLAEYACFEGNISTHCKQILRKVNTDKLLGQFVRTNYAFFVLSRDSFVYVVACDANYQLRIAVSFLKEIQAIFKQKFPESRRKTAINFGLNKQFSPVLQAKMREYADKRNVDKISQLRKKMSDLQEQALKNIDKIIDRNQKLQVMVARAQVMADTSYDLKGSATKVRRAMWWKNKKLIVIIIVIVLLVIFVIVVLACGGFNFTKCKSSAYSIA